MADNNQKPDIEEGSDPDRPNTTTNGGVVDVPVDEINNNDCDGAEYQKQDDTRDDADESAISSSIPTSGSNIQPTSQNSTSDTDLPSNNNADLNETTTDDDRKMFRYGSVRMPQLMEQFLVDSLVTSEIGNDDRTIRSTSDHHYENSESGNPGNDNSRHSTHDGGGGTFSNLGDVVLETNYDMTEERLRQLFTMFDFDGDGRVSYEELKRGLAYQTLGLKSHLKDDSDFTNLVSYLDIDQSGDISFEEFSEGLRLILLRSLLKAVKEKKDGFNHLDDNVVTEVNDYNPHKLERHLVEVVEDTLQSLRDARSSRQPASLAVSVSVQTMSVIELFFLDRPEWIRVRWINITGHGREYASRALKMCALKYKLHPLALEDALDCNNQRPKADSYKHRKFFVHSLCTGLISLSVLE
jgi:EF-hand domain pair